MSSPPSSASSSYYKTIEPNLTGLFLVPGDLPTTVQSATYQIAAQAEQGVNWIGAVKVSGRDEQSAYTPRVQAARNGNANYIYDGSNDTAFINMRREAAAQGLDSVKIWACSLACYTEKFKAAGADVEGTYVWMQFIPFEEKGSNQELDNYLASVATPDSFGAQAWMAAVLFQQAVDKIVETDGPNAITRASLLDGAERHRLLRRQRLDGCQGPEGRLLRLHGHHADEVGGFERIQPDGDGHARLQPLVPHQGHPRPGGRGAEDPVVDEHGSGPAARPPAPFCARRHTGLLVSVKVLPQSKHQQGETSEAISMARSALGSRPSRRGLRPE